MSNSNPYESELVGGQRNQPEGGYAGAGPVSGDRNGLQNNTLPHDRSSTRLASSGLAGGLPGGPPGQHSGSASGTGSGAVPSPSGLFASASDSNLRGANQPVLPPISSQPSPGSTFTGQAYPRQPYRNSTSYPGQVIKSQGGPNQYSNPYGWDSNPNQNVDDGSSSGGGARNSINEPRSGGKPRMRVSKACDRCRVQKIKCSGTQPCATCTKQKKECTFSTTYALGEKGRTPDGDDVPNKRHRSQPIFGFPVIQKSYDRSYMDHLEHRVQYLEGLLANNGTNTFRTAGTDFEREPPFLISPSSKWRFSRRHQNLLTVDLCQSMYDGLSEESRQLVTLPRMQYFGWNMSGCNYLSPEELPNLPEYEEKIDTDLYIDYFLDEVNPLFSILHETVFREQVHAYQKLLSEQLNLKTSVNDRESKTNQTRLFSAILHLIYAISIRLIEMGKPRGPSLPLLQLEEKFFKYGHRVVQILSFEWESFELIQSWLLISLYLRISHRQTSAYHALGQAVIITQSMGIGQNVFKIHLATPYEKMKAKRIFWSVYTFDRLFSMQTGRYTGIRDEDTIQTFPSLDYKKESESDDWLTLASFAMIQLSRIANFIHSTVTDEPETVKYHQLNKELAIMEEWLNDNGFANGDIFAEDLQFEEPESDKESETSKESKPHKQEKKIQPLTKLQVKLHFYDLILCVHGKIIFNYVGRRIKCNGLSVDMVVDACEGVLDLLERCHKAGKLFVPWYQQLLMMFNIGVYAITLINGGAFVVQARKILKGCINLCTVLKRASVRDEASRKVLVKERFKMAKECLWALKMANRMLTLRLQEDIKALNGIGIDHGSSDVNIQMFSQIGLNSERLSKKKQPRDDEFSALLKKQLHRSDIPEDSEEEHEDPKRHEQMAYQQQVPVYQDSQDNSQQSQHPQHPQQQNPEPYGVKAEFMDTPSSTNSMDQPVQGYNGQVLGPDGQPQMNEVDYMLGNLQWFDQWMDFAYEFK